MKCICFTYQNPKLSERFSSLNKVKDSLDLFAKRGGRREIFGRDAMRYREEILNLKDWLRITTCSLSNRCLETGIFREDFRRAQDSVI